MNAGGDLVGEVQVAAEVLQLAAAGRHLVCVLDDGRVAAHSFD